MDVHLLPVSLHSLFFMCICVLISSSHKDTSIIRLRTQLNSVEFHLSLITSAKTVSNQEIKENSIQPNIDYY